MPLYPYRCEACEAEFETLRPLSARDEKALCPECGAQKGERVYKPFAVNVAAKGGAPACPTAHSCPHGGSCGCH